MNTHHETVAKDLEHSTKAQCLLNNSFIDLYIYKKWSHLYNKINYEFEYNYIDN